MAVKITHLALSKLPKRVQRKAASLGVTEEACLFGARTDLTLDARPRDMWLIVTRDKALAIEVGLKGNGQVLGPFPLSDVEKVRTFQTVGSAFLQFMVKGVYVNVVRYSNAYRDEFNRICAQIENLLKGRDLDTKALIKPSDYICRVCGLPLPASGAHCARCASRRGVFYRSLGLMKPYRRYILLLLGMMLAGVGLDLVPPMLQRTLVDKVLLPRRHTDWLPLILMTMLGIATTRCVLSIFIGRTASLIGTRITKELRERLQRKLLALSVDYYDRNSAGNLMSRVLNDVDSFQGFVLQVAQGFLLNAILILGIGVMLFYMDPLLAFLVILPMPLVVVGTLLYWRYILPRYRRFQDSRAKMSKGLVGLLAGIRLVKAFGQEEREQERFERSATYMQNAQRSVQMSRSVYNPIMAYVFGLGGLIIWYAGGNKVVRGMSLGTLMAFFAYMAMFYQPITMMTMFTDWLTGFVAAGQRVFEILDAVPSLKEPKTPARTRGIRGSIELRDVTFGYDPYNPVLKNVNLKIEAGQFVGIVGKSGSGKTTLMNLICRFYDTQQGQVMIDGRDVQKIHREDLRRDVALVLQETFLFRASIAENIAYGRPDAHPETIIEAARAANCHDFISQRPAAYDTQLGERGAGLSGGERQRVSIARALLCDPRILILDEATSSVDTESEQEIQKALGILGRGRTTIAVAHRLSTLKNAHLIYVIDEERVVESGSHKELMALNGVYARLVRIQTELTRLELD